MSEKYKRNPNTKCVICSKEIYRRPCEIEKSGGQVFCSNMCYGISCRKEVLCAICAKPMLSRLNKKTCSRSCANKQRAGIDYKKQNSRDKVKSQRSLKIRLLDQRGEKCERCGFDKVQILQVHHKNRDRNNNELGNLEIICPNCHATEHYSEKSWLSR
jgi:hypothetical protein